jgi:hypothetical protein
MGRKNYKTKGTRRKHVVEYVMPENQANYVVTLTNGSGMTNVTVTGTPVSSWNWCIRAGAAGGIQPGTWWPIAIKREGSNDAIFSVV